MSKHDKLLDKAVNNPAGLGFKEFKTLMSRHKWKFDHQRGSHEIWRSPSGERISIQNKHGKAKEYQLKQFLKMYSEEGNNGK